MAADLIPVDQPYGERKKFIEGMAVARQPAPPLPGAPAAPGGGRPMAGAAPEPLDFDPLLDMQPIPPDQQSFVQPSPRDRLIDAATNSPNPLMREAARRLLEDQ